MINVSQTQRWEQLYKSGLKKQQSLIIQKAINEKYLGDEQNIRQEISQCTFKPQITQQKKNTIDTKIESSPVYDRLQKQGKQNKTKQCIAYDLSKQQKIIGCTFKPQINSNCISENISRKSLSQSQMQSDSKSDTFNRLYQDAEIQRIKIQKIKQIKDSLDSQQYNYQPQLSPNHNAQQSVQFYLQIPVEKRLYESHLAQTQNKINKQMIVHEAELRECTFAPKINDRNTLRIENINIYDRLYNLGQAQEQKLLNKQQEKAKQDTIKPSLINQNSQIIVDSLRNQPNNYYESNDYRNSYKSGQNCYERLYQENIRKDQRQQQNSARIMYEMGYTFQPNLYKGQSPNEINNNPSQTQIYNPSVSSKGSNLIQNQNFLQNESNYEEEYFIAQQ